MAGAIDWTVAERVADYDEHGTRWTTLRDPEGNLFDIAHIDS